MIHKKSIFLKKVQKILYPLSKPPPKFGEILVIWGGIRQRVLRYLKIIIFLLIKKNQYFF